MDFGNPTVKAAPRQHNYRNYITRLLDMTEISLHRCPRNAVLMLSRDTDLNEEQTKLQPRTFGFAKRSKNLKFSPGDFSYELRLRIVARSLRWV